MNKVMQRKQDDCLVACLATLLDIEYETIPDFQETPDQWLNVLRSFTNSLNYDFELLNEIPLSYLKGKKVIGVGPSPRPGSDKTHAVIVDENLNVIHDPYWPLDAVKEINYVLVFKEKNAKQD